MNFQAAADLVAALRPFTRPTRASHMEGVERLVRAASGVTGELQEVKRLMPARAVRSRSPGDQTVAVESDPGETIGDRDDFGTAISTHPAEEADPLRGSSSLSGGGVAGSSALILLLILILLLDSR